VEESLGADAYGRDLLARMRSTPAKTRQARLERIRKVLAVAVPNLTELELVADENNHPHLQARFQHWRAPAAKQDEREFSDGTLRLIGLLWALQEKSGPLLLEEPELSLHTALVRQLAPFVARAQRAAGGRQAFISTHSDELMSDEGIGPNEILLVRAAAEGSTVVLGADLAEIRTALEAGLTAADVVMPLTAQAQLALFSQVDCLTWWVWWCMHSSRGIWRRCSCPSCLRSWGAPTCAPSCAMRAAAPSSGPWPGASTRQGSTKWCSVWPTWSRPRARLCCWRSSCPAANRRGFTCASQCACLRAGCWPTGRRWRAFCAFPWRQFRRSPMRRRTPSAR